MQNSGVECDAQQSVRGLSSGEDLVKFAEENEIDHIFLGIKKKSRAQKPSSAPLPDLSSLRPRVL